MKTPEPIDELMALLKAWCNAKYGRQVAAAKSLGVSPQALPSWFRRDNDSTASHTLGILALLATPPRPLCPAN
ncbi:MAG: hypothetical protein JO069_19485 [Verrucomicrobia bacterium]|nr:hypothetical protein [Verrucomicrobiota bacterium]